MTIGHLYLLTNGHLFGKCGSEKRESPILGIFASGMWMKRRARDEEEKAARKEAILRAAEVLWSASGGVLPSMQEIAHEAGLVKGTLYLYFQSKEDLYLTLLEGFLHGWMEAIAAEAVLLGEVSREEAVRRLVWVIGSHAQARPSSLRLAGMSHSTLEPRLSVDRALRFKRDLASSLGMVAAAIARVMPSLSVEQGAQLLLFSYSMVLGLWPHLEPPEVIASILSQEELTFFRVTPEKDLQEALLSLWHGYLARCDAPITK
jgi:AcrR family transcriptional regulator